jgi:LysM repeat protein/ABC-type branched-subunit amino acid transport system substrate-binding protein
MRNLILSFFCIVCIGTIFSQEIYPTEVREGKKYFVHQVIAGNTLYGLQKTYGVEVKELIAVNPTLASGLKLNTVVFIPIPATATVDHIVEKKETVYSISKKYFVSQNLLLKYNPGIDKSLAKGQTIKIPIGEVDGSTPVNSPGTVATKSNVESIPLIIKEDPKQIEKPIEKPIDTKELKDAKDAKVSVVPAFTVSFTDSIIDYTVKPKETLYSIAKRFMVTGEEIRKTNNLSKDKLSEGQTIKIILKKENIKPVEIRKIDPRPENIIDEELIFPNKSRFKIAYLLPFFLDKVPTGKLDVAGIKENATDFWMGAQLALDSLNKRGLNADVNVYDIANDSASIMAVLNKTEMKDVDLVIGPLFSENSKLIAEWCKAKGIRMLAPVQSSTAVIEKNKYINLGVASDITQYSHLAEYTAKTHLKENVILVSLGNKKEEDLLATFKTIFNSNLASKSYNSKIIETNLEGLGALIKKDVNNVIVFVSKDKTSALKVLNVLNKISAKAGSRKITLIAPREWGNLEDFDGEFKEKHSYTCVSPNNFSYEDPIVKQTLRQYRNKYQADLTKFSAQGFDITYLGINALLRNVPSNGGIMSDLKLTQKGEGNGYENSHSVILRQKDLEMIVVGVK